MKARVRVRVRASLKVSVALQTDRIPGANAQSPSEPVNLFTLAYQSAIPFPRPQHTDKYRQTGGPIRPCGTPPHSAA